MTDTTSPAVPIIVIREDPMIAALYTQGSFVW